MELYRWGKREGDITVKYVERLVPMTSSAEKDIDTIYAKIVKEKEKKRTNPQPQNMIGKNITYRKRLETA